jgi:hypothetical protein
MSVSLSGASASPIQQLATEARRPIVDAVTLEATQNLARPQAIETGAAGQSTPLSTPPDGQGQTINRVA